VQVVTARVEELRQRDAVALEQLGQAKQLATRFEERDAAQKAEAVARIAGEQAENDRQVLDRARAAERVRAQLDLVRRAEEEASARAHQEEVDAEAKKEAKERQGRAEARAVAAEAEAPETRRIEGRAAELERALPDLQRLSGLDATLARQKKDVEGAKAKAGKGRMDVEAAEARIAKLGAERDSCGPLAAEVPARLDEARSLEGALGAARDREKLRGQVSAQEKAAVEASRAAKRSRAAADLATKKAREVQTQREERLAAWLARSALHDGEACPVCGSTDHPAPARAEGHIPEEQEVTDAQAQAERLARTAGDDGSKLSLANGILDDLKRRLVEASAREARPVEDLEQQHADASVTLARAREAATRIATLDEQLAAAQSHLGAARNAQVEAESLVGAAQEAAIKTETAASEIRQRLAAIGARAGADEEVRKLRVDLREREERARKAMEERQAAAAHFAEAATRSALAVEAREKADRSLAEARVEADAACYGAGFAGVEACREALLPPGRQAELETSIQRRLSAHLAERQRLDRVNEELGNAARPDVSAFEAARAATEMAAREADGVRVSLGAEETQVAGMLRRVADLDAQAEKVAGELGVVGHVA
jgi:exonuclease SbcC